jgi:pimeloyl-ACP methyl ester carboxylesterase
MEKSVVFPGRVILTLLLLAGLAGCMMPNQPAEEPPEEALSHEQLLANLDTLQGPATRSLTQPNMTVFTLPSGSRLSTRDLSAYLNAIKTDLAACVSARTAGKPYLVVPMRLSWNSAYGPESGLMWMPFTWGRPRSFPVIAYQHGTQVYRQCAPSRFNANPLSVLASPDLTGALQNYVECTVGALMASAGYIVAMPDYIGFGDSIQDHPFVTMELGESVKGALDAAFKALKSRVVSPRKNVSLAGYSEGGYATMAGALALGLQYEGEPLCAVVPCGGPYDLAGTMLNQMLYDTDVKVPSYLLYTASGYHAVYDDQVDYDELLLPDYAGYLEAGRFDGTHTNAEIAALGLPSTPSEMLTEAAYQDLTDMKGAVYTLLLDNDGWMGWDTYQAASLVPVSFVHCLRDDVVPFGNAVVAVGALQLFGVPVSLIPVPPVPFLDLVAGSIHAAAYPTAMLAAFTIIDGLN